MIDGLLDAIADLGPVMLHLAVAGLAFAETAFLVDLLVPGEVGMVIVGAAGHRGDAALLTLILAGSAGAVVGDTSSYLLGRFGGARLRRRLGPAQRAQLAKAEVWFQARGGSAVFLGRWVGALRAVVPLVAGAARMPMGSFLTWNVLASVGWVSTTVTLGWVAGDRIAGVADRVGATVSIVVVAALAGWWWRAHQHARTVRSEIADGGRLPEEIVTEARMGDADQRRRPL